MRIAYDIVSIEVDRLLIKSVTARTPKRSQYYWSEYISYLEACGWTQQEFDEESIRRIDLAWDNSKQRN